MALPPCFTRWAVVMVLGISSLVAAPDAPKAAPAASGQPTVGANQAANQDPAFVALLVDSTKLIQADKFDEALKKLDEADQHQPRNIEVFSLRGIVYTKKREFETARSWFERASEIDPKLFEPRFNAAEMLFVQKNFADARIRFQTLASDYPEKPLVRYKLFLTALMLDETASSDAILKSADPYDAWPNYYYASAAKSFKAGDTEKAMSFVNSAHKIYNPQTWMLYEDSLMEIGWIAKPKETINVRSQDTNENRPLPVSETTTHPAIPAMLPPVSSGNKDERVAP